MTDLFDMFIYIQEMSSHIPTDSLLFDKVSLALWRPIVKQSLFVASLVLKSIMLFYGFTGGLARGFPRGVPISVLSVHFLQKLGRKAEMRIVPEFCVFLGFSSPISSSSFFGTNIINHIINYFYFQVEALLRCVKHPIVPPQTLRTCQLSTVQYIIQNQTSSENCISQRICQVKGD